MPRPTSALLVATVAATVALAGNVRPQTVSDLTDRFFSTTLLGGAPLGAIHGVEFAPSGLLYVSDGAPALFAIDVRTRTVRTVLQGLPLGAPGRMVFGDGRVPLGTDLILADWDTEVTSPCCDGRVLRIDVGTGAVQVLATGNPQFPAPGDPGAVALSPGGAWGSRLFVMDFEGASPNPPVLYSVDAGPSASTFVVDPGQWTIQTRPFDLAFGVGAGFGDDLYVTDEVAGRVWRVTSGAQLTPFLSPPGSPRAVAFGPGGAFGSDLYFLTADGASLDLYRADAGGNLAKLGAGLGPPQAFPDFAFAPGGKALYVGAGARISVVVPATLILDVQPDPARAGQVLTIATTAGTPGAPALVLAERLNGAKVEPPALVTVLTLDAAGAGSLSLRVPPGLPALDIGLQVLSFDGAGDLAVSNKDEIRFR